MKRERLFVSTTAEDDTALAASEGLGLEIAEFCTAYNMDLRFGEYGPLVAGKMAKASRFAFHAPFNELCPAAIDPLVLDVAKRRYAQAFRLASELGIGRIIVHSGYVPLVYFKSWFAERSVEFWSEFMAGLKAEEGLVVCLENVMEDEPELLADIVRRVGDGRFRLCLDLGHAYCQSRLPLSEWVDCAAPYLEHVHMHDNDGARDLHACLGEGSLPMCETLRHIERLCPRATYTIENVRAAPSVEWLKNKGILED